MKRTTAPLVLGGFVLGVLDAFLYWLIKPQSRSYGAHDTTVVRLSCPPPTTKPAKENQHG